MGRSRLVVPPPGTTPSGFRSSAAEPRALPADLLRDAKLRLSVMSLLAVVLWVLGTLGYHLAVAQRNQAWWSWRSSDVIAVANIAVSIGLFLYARSRERDPRFVLDLGLVYLVITSLAIGVILHWDHREPVHLVPIIPSVSWISAVMLMFAAVLPTSPMKVLVAGLFSASMGPLGMIVAKARGVWDFGPLSNVIVMHYEDYLAVGAAVVVSHVVTGLGREVAKAREMGSYKLGDLLGSGGMGEVYRATHQLLARPAAVKLIRPEALGARDSSAVQAAITRFKREAMAAANLRSPHTVALYDFGVADDGTLYFAMELLDGLDLESLVRQNGSLPAARVIHILRQVCESLEEAHATGLVHRDIKPANIHIGRLGLINDFVKVLDFGLVKSVSDSAVTHTDATRAGVTVGTPAYMAPEMALGQPIDGRADIYALGCVAYFLLTAQVVFEGAEGLQTLVRRLNEDPPLPSSRTDLPIPAELERIVMSCLARDAGARPTATTLQRLLGALPIDPWTESAAAEWWRVNRTTAP